MADGADTPRASRWLDAIERVGNALPDPATLFALGALAVAIGAQIAVATDWSVERPVAQPRTEALLDAAGEPLVGADGEPLRRAVLDAADRPVIERVDQPLRARSLLTADGIYWALDSLVENFTSFPPLGVVLVGMLGIGMAERTGFIGALLQALLVAWPRSLLTPAVVFLGIMSSMGLDAGYVVLPPVAAALYRAVGRSPLAGIAAVFSGVSAGFSANLLPTSLDPLLAELSTVSAHLVDPSYEVAASANWGFMVASTVLLTLVGWAVTAIWVEPRLAKLAPEDGGPDVAAAEAAAGTELSARERRALKLASAVAVGALALFALASWLPGMPLHGVDGKFPRWVQAIVPMLFLGFLVPGVVYGFASGRLANDRDVAKIFGETMASMGPYIVLAFFAAQFIAWFAYSNVGEMLAITGGRALASAALPAAGLMVGFVGVVGVANLFIGSMSAKYAFLAPVFVPMFMAAGISPELTQAAYRVGDSATNVITPLNPYLVIVLGFVQRHAPRAGVGTLVALMLPYAAVFLAVWSAVLALWVGLGVPLGPEGPLAYTAPGP